MGINSINNSINNSACPFCRKNYYGFNFKINYILKDLINQLLFKCSNDDCDWQGKFLDFDYHLNYNCSEIEIRCKECKLQMKKKNYDFHFKNECDYRIMQCEFCQKEIYFIELSTHKDNCLKRKVKCYYCDQEVIFCELECNHANVCKKFKIKCKHCGDYISKKEQSQHNYKLHKNWIKCRYCYIKFAKGYLMKHEKGCAKNPKNLLFSEPNNYFEEYLKSGILLKKNGFITTCGPDYF